MKLDVSRLLVQSLTGCLVRFALLGLVVVMAGEPVRASTCDEQFYSFQSRDSLKPKLPRRGTPTYRAMVSQVASQLLATRSFATLDLTRVFQPALIRRWQMSFPIEFASQLHRESILPSESGHVMAQSRQAYEAQLHATRELQDWFRTFLLDVTKPVLAEAYGVAGGSKSLPQWAQVGEGFAAIRNSTAAEKSLLFGEWHPDGGGLSVTLSTKGAGTEVLGGVPISYVKSGADIHGKGEKWLSLCEGCRPFTVPTGHALILIGSSAIARGEEVVFTPTIHRTPSYTGERQLFLFRY